MFATRSLSRQCVRATTTSCVRVAAVASRAPASGSLVPRRHATTTALAPRQQHTRAAATATAASRRGLASAARGVQQQSPGRQASAFDSTVRGVVYERAATLAPERDEGAAVGAAEIEAFLLERQFDDVLVVDMREKAAWCDAQVFATGRSGRQLLAAARALLAEFKERIPVFHDDRDLIEADDEWVLVDCGLVVVQLFTQEGRDKYQLDRLWLNRPTLDEIFMNGADENMLSEEDQQCDDSWVDGYQAVENPEELELLLPPGVKKPTKR